jgi:ribonucleotide reductase alpha subunit
MIAELKKTKFLPLHLSDNPVTFIEPLLTEQEKSQIQYWNTVKPELISWGFYSKYLDKPTKLDTLGMTTYLRTYSRYVPEIKRREKWCECVLRVVEYSMSLDQRDYPGKVEEAEKLFDNIYNLRTFPAGRTLWIGGTKQTQIDASANWNCCATVIDSISCFSEIFYWLMIGAGEGFNISEKYQEKLTKGQQKLFSPEWFTVTHSCPSVKTPRRYRKNLIERGIPQKDETELLIKTLDGSEYIYNLTRESLKISDEEFENSFLLHINQAETIKIVVGDSKEGWANTLRAMMHLFKTDVVMGKIPAINSLADPQQYEDAPVPTSKPFSPRFINLEFDYSWIRKKGERIKTFGGRASGYQALKEMLHKIYVVLMLKQGNMSTELLLDICTTIGQCVVAGGVRRTALIAFSELSDEQFIKAKYNLWGNDEKLFYRQNRVMSNNSVSLLEKPTWQQFKAMFEYMANNGEPGLSMLGNAKKYDPEIEVFNPCHEAGLRSKQSCNLTTNNVDAFVVKFNNQYEFLYREWYENLALNTRMGLRITLQTQWHPKWDEVQKSQRLLGVSMTGVETAIDKLGWTNEQLADFLAQSKIVAEESAAEYAAELGIPTPARVCLVKPEGTISTVANVSAGLHKDYSPYYIRRVRYSKLDPLAQVLRQLGLDPKPENDQGNDLDSDLCQSWVFSFPVAKPECKQRAIDESAQAQFDRYLTYQRNWVSGGHNASVTISVDYPEWDGLAKSIYDNYDDVIGVSTLPKFDPLNSPYPQLAYEPITRERYEELVAAMPQFTENKLIALVAKIEQDDEEPEYEIMEDACATGSCPIR